jgi:methyl-accepting chemotaxis protein
MANLADTTGTIKEKIPGIMDRVAARLDEFRVALDKTSGLLDEVQATATNAKDLTGNIRSLLASNRSRLDEIIKSANLASQNLAAASSEIRRSPWRLLYKPSDSEVANLNLYDAARQFAEASRKLQDSSMALRDTLQDPEVNEESVKQLLRQLDIDFADYKKVESALLERVK